MLILKKLSEYSQKRRIKEMIWRFLGDSGYFGNSYNRVCCRRKVLVIDWESLRILGNPKFVWICWERKRECKGRKKKCWRIFSELWVMKQQKKDLPFIQWPTLQLGPARWPTRVWGKIRSVCNGWPLCAYFDFLWALIVVLLFFSICYAVHFILFSSLIYFV